mgnify:CR=1 FL=1
MFQSGQQNTTYDGSGGVSVGSPLHKLLFAARFGELNILLSEQVTDKSRILFNRTPEERVKALAPWLTLDSDPYPAVIDGRIVWIVDGYTTSDAYPYSQFSDFGNSISDSANVSGAHERLNYLRNSVKATVDAYDGTVTLYGRVHSFYQRQICLQCCQRVAGVIRLVDRIEVESMSEPAVAV